MTMTDPISDLLTRIRNGYQAKLLELNVPYSKVKKNILSVLEKEGYIKDVLELSDEKNFKSLSFKLIYSLKGNPAIIKIERVSKPGKRIYKSISEIKSYYGGLGTSIISTSQGVMSYKNALKSSIGGELICNIF